LIERKKKMSKNMNLFATVLTYAAPSSNYRGESEENRTVLQKITRGGKDYTVISPESMRNAIRDILANDLPHNRTRLHDEGQPAVEFKDLPDATKYADDFLFGYLVAKDEFAKKMKEAKPKRDAKRDSVLRINMAVSLARYEYRDALFNQSPHNGGKSPWRNDSKSNLLHREVHHTAYQYPFALSSEDCRKGDAKWTKTLLKAIGQLSNVAGGHARSYFEMSPASIVVRLTPNLVAGYNTYGFDEKGGFHELQRINADDLTGAEFSIGGELSRNMSPDEKARLTSEGVHFYDNSQKLLEAIAEEFLKAEG
jgi:CRISPR-associated protein Cst2